MHLKRSFKNHNYFLQKGNRKIIIKNKLTFIFMKVICFIFMIQVRVYSNKYLIGILNKSKIL